MPIITHRTRTFDCTAQGGELATPVTLRGWLAFTGADSDNDIEGEAHYSFVPDLAWARAQGIEIERLVRVGNLTEPCGPLRLPDLLHRRDLVGKSCVRGSCADTCRPRREDERKNCAHDRTPAGVGQCAAAYARCVGRGANP